MTDTGEPVPGLSDVDLSALPAGWQKLSAADGVSPQSGLELVFVPLGEAAPIPEIEVWALATGKPVPTERRSEIAVISAAVPGQIDWVLADPPRLELTPGRLTGACGTFGFTLARPPAAYRRGWLVYEAAGVFRPFVLTRALNSGPMHRGQWTD